MKCLIAVASEDNGRKDNQDAMRCARSVLSVLTKEGYSAEIFSVTPRQMADIPALALRIKEIFPKIIFNFFEGFRDDAGQEIIFARLLEKLKIPFTGNGSQTLAHCLDKNICKNMLKDAGIKVPDGIVVRELSSVDLSCLTFPVFLKPCAEDASIGIDEDSLCNSAEQCQRALVKKLAKYSRGIMVEEFISGPEYNASFLGRAPYQMLAASCIDYQGRKRSPFLSYEAKWNENDPDYTQLTPKVLTDRRDPLIERIREIGMLAGEALECRGYFRVDLRERAGDLFVLDVNPNPDINEDAGLVRQASSAGISYDQLILKILKETGYANVK